MKQTEVRTKILEMLPVYQQDAWRKLGLEHRQISKVVRKLEAEGLLVRKWYKGTFFLKITPAGNKERQKIVSGKEIVFETKAIPVLVIKKEPKFTPLISNGIFSPCTGCKEECEPASCTKLLVWVAT